MIGDSEADRMKEGELKERRRDGGEVCDAGKDGGGASVGISHIPRNYMNA